MKEQKKDLKKDKRIVGHWLAHHNPERDDFENHVFYLFNYAICIGCFAFFLGVGITLILGNIFYFYIINFINFPTILILFLVCWIPSILQYTLQIIRKKALKNRAIKFLIRFVYPVGSILFIFHSPLWGFPISIAAGYLIIYIRKLKNRALSENT
ncbi:MAG: hypothetical protein ACFE75_02915 [Candidatus Hodarchaeota archaeon]